MLQIKTIGNDFQKSDVFDKEVNDAIAEGWELVKRELVDSPKYGDLVLYAELEKEDEAETVEAPEPWRLTRDPALPYRCPHCGYKTDLPGGQCPSCESYITWEDSEE